MYVAALSPRPVDGRPPGHHRYPRMGPTLLVAALTAAIPLTACAAAGPLAGRNRQQDPTESECGDSIDDPRNRRVGLWRSRLFKAVRLEDRLALLTEIGLTDSEIAQAMPDGGSGRSVRRWRKNGVTQAREAALWQPVDDLCAIVSYLLADGTYDERGALAWLRSRHPDLAQQRPLAILGSGEFDGVLRAAEITLGAAPNPTAPQPPGPITQAIAAQGAGQTEQATPQGEAEDASEAHDEVARPRS